MSDFKLSIFPFVLVPEDEENPTEEEQVIQQEVEDLKEEIGDAPRT